MDNVDIAGRIKNGSIIVKIYLKPSTDNLLTKKVNLKGITTGNVGWAADNTNLRSNNNISKRIRVNIAITRAFFKEYLISFLIVCKLIDLALVVFRLLIFKVCGIIVISKIEFFNFSGNEKVNYLKVVLKCLTPLLLTCDSQYDLFCTSFGWLRHGDTTRLRWVGSRSVLIYICYKNTSIRLVWNRLNFFILRILKGNVIGKMGYLRFMISVWYDVRSYRKNCLSTIPWKGPRK